MLDQVETRRVTAIVFDLDGTLIDSAPDIHAAANRMLASQSAAPLDLATVTSFIGNGLPKLVERVMRAGGLDMETHARLTQMTLDYYNAASADLTVPYPGVVAALHRFRSAGYAMGVCTNKPEAPARDILAALGLEGFFGAIVGGDALPVKKPDPAPLLHVFEKLNARDRLYVGDSEIDAETAQRADVDFALFTNGYRKRPVAELTYVAAFSDFGDLPGIVDNVFAPGTPA